jgi:RES domain-containing protein
MLVYRIAKMKERAHDISGKGAFLYGGRWNSAGTFMLYTSMNASLAMLELLVHADESEIPPQMFIAQIEIAQDAPIFEFPDQQLPNAWREPGNLQLKTLGDRLMTEKNFLGLKVRSAVLPSEWNILLNPLYPGYADLVVVRGIEKFETDIRLV